MKLKHFFLLTICLFALMACNKKSASGDANDPDRFKGTSLNILCWEGYADASFTKAFEDKYGCKVQGTYFGSSDELV